MSANHVPIAPPETGLGLTTENLRRLPGKAPSDHIRSNPASKASFSSNFITEHIGAICREEKDSGWWEMRAASAMYLLYKECGPEGRDVLYAEELVLETDSSASGLRRRDGKLLHRDFNFWRDKALHLEERVSRFRKTRPVERRLARYFPEVAREIENWIPKPEGQEEAWVPWPSATRSTPDADSKRVREKKREKRWEEERAAFADFQERNLGGQPLGEGDVWSWESRSWRSATPQADSVQEREEQSGRFQEALAYYRERNLRDAKRGRDDDDSESELPAKRLKMQPSPTKSVDNARLASLSGSPLAFLPVADGKPPTRWPEPGSPIRPSLNKSVGNVSRARPAGKKGGRKRSECLNSRQEPVGSSTAQQPASSSPPPQSGGLRRRSTTRRSTRKRTTTHKTQTRAQPVALRRSARVAARQQHRDAQCQING